MKDLTKVEVSITQWIKDTGEGQIKGIPVPCGECRTCCSHINAQLYPEEIKFYKNKFSKSDGKYHLKRNSNDTCVYLNDRGCSIHDHVPKVCKTFDCRYMGFFNIKNPKNENLTKASKRWIFINDNNEIWQHLTQYFRNGLALMPIKSGDRVDYCAKAALLSAYNKFFVKTE